MSSPKLNAGNSPWKCRVCGPGDNGASIRWTPSATAGLDVPSAIGSPVAASTLSCEASVQMNRGESERYLWLTLNCLRLSPSSSAEIFLAPSMIMLAQSRSCCSVDPLPSAVEHSVFTMGKKSAFPEGTLQVRTAVPLQFGSPVLQNFPPRNHTLPF